MGNITWTKLVPDELLPCAARRPKMNRTRVSGPGVKKAFPQAIINSYKWQPKAPHSLSKRGAKRKANEPSTFVIPREACEPKANRKKLKLPPVKSVRFLVPPVPSPPPPYTSRDPSPDFRAPCETWPMRKRVFTFKSSAPSAASAAETGAGTGCAGNQTYSAEPAPFPIPWGQMVMLALWCGAFVGMMAAIPAHDKCIILAAVLAAQMARAIYLA